MQVKFKKRLEDYDYILSFDLAKHITGYGLIGVHTQKIYESGVIITKKDSEMPWQEFYDKTKEVILSIREKYGNNFFITKERLPYQNGPRSSIAALQELAKTHAVFDLLVSQLWVDYYDWDGVSSVSVRAFIKKETGIEKPSKEDVLRYIRTKYQDWSPLLEVSGKKYDTNSTDAIGVGITLMQRKWDSDLDIEIKELRKKGKTLKKDSAIEENNQKIAFLQSLKNNQKEVPESGTTN